MSEPQSVDKSLMVLRLIVAATIAGLVAFTGVVMIVGGPQHAEPEMGRTLVIVLVALAVVATLLPLLLYKPFVNKARFALAEAPQDADSAPIAMPKLFAYTVISVAGGDMLGFVAAVGHLLTQERTALWAVGLALLLLVRQFPTRGAWERFLADVKSADEA